MATKPANPAPLSGIALLDASQPFADTPRGGWETGFTGESGTKPSQNGTQNGSDPAQRLIDQFTGQQDFTGMGSWLEEDDTTVYQTANNLVLRQELLAINRLAQDVHFTRIKLGYPFSILEKDPNKDTYRSSLPAGTKALTIQAVPNQAWDLVNKATEAVLADPPQPDPAPMDDSEEAHAAAQMAERFLTEDGGENGTNDVALFFNAVDRSLTCATSYIDCWTDPVGGGSVPLQILAHPQATDPANPLVGPDGMPTTDPILRYVTAPTGGQFTDHPAEAAPEWQPKIRAQVWGREHWRCYPETETVAHAEKAIGLLYCTIAEAKRRWPLVAQMSTADLNALLSWQPVRALVLLPPYERARWRIQTGSDTEKSGSADERILFYYRVLQTATPDHQQGAEVCVTGALGGKVLYRNTLSATLEVPSRTENAAGKERIVRPMDLPLIQVTPRADPDDRDPTGRCYIEMFSGATEFNATLASGYLEALNLWLHPEKYAPSTTTVQGFQIAESRATGDAIPILTKDDVPQYGPQPPLPPTFFTALEWNDQAIRSIASLNKPVTGQDTSREVSGKARQIAVQQGMVGLSRMQHPVNSAYERFCRVKIQLAMRDFQTPQTLRYVGEDGSWQAEQWTGTDFALVGSVGVQAGTGTMLTPEAKLQFLANLKAEGMLPPEDANDAARPTYAQRLGLADDPHEQFVKRCVTLWTKGPPTGWVEQWQQYVQQRQQYQQVMQQFQQAQQAYQVAQQNTAIVQGGPPPILGPENQNAAAMQQYQQAVLALQQNPLPPAPPVPPQIRAPVPPWHPFQSRPNDDEPPIASKWMRQLSDIISTVQYDAMPKEWTQPLVERYQHAVGVMEAVQGAAQQAAQPPKAKQPTHQPQQPAQPTQPTQQGQGGGIPG